MTEYNRVEQWRAFSKLVEEHITDYTLRQYGNSEGNEQVDNFTVEDCWENINRYYNRRKSAVRGEKERLRDPLKVAHYAQFIHDKLMGENANVNNTHFVLLDAIDEVLKHWSFFPKHQYGSDEVIISSESVINLQRAYEKYIEEQGL